MAKRLMLTMSDELYAALEQKRKRFGYMTVQETINDIVRKSLFEARKGREKGGRPPKLDDPLIAAFARKI